ncbi:hypothetical protein [Aliikangiella coralliicola]|uniref:Uncharacterized protein n=1 Tax=Aliikangiella coralliicola TaxID=2592383 RepID=A0A545TZX9_9GAMM|nr:hypothetical protein [Aliikangiella coralliicola]TQV82770.1 hypothetical protein FLL46_23640 [Aliikangiella coralliicola]
MIKDFLKRKKISQFAHEIVATHFTEVEKRKIESSVDAKREKRVKALTSKLKSDVIRFKKTENLGVYGKAKLLKDIQTELDKHSLNSELTHYVINSLLR